MRLDKRRCRPSTIVGFISAIFAYNKLLGFGLIVYLLIATGLSGFFFAGLKKISKMRSEYEALERNTEYYAEQNEIKKKLNDELRHEVDVLVRHNVKYVAQNLAFKENVLRLNNTVIGYGTAFANIDEQIIELEEKNENYRITIGILNTTLVHLDEKLEDTNATLISIKDTKEALLQFNDNLKKNIIKINNTKNALSFEVERLTNVVDFIEDHAVSNQKEFDSLVDKLNKLVKENNDILQENRRQILNRDMGRAVQDGLDELLNYFRFESRNRLESPVLGSYTNCLQKIEKDILHSICCNMTDFEAYLFVESEKDKSAAGRISFEELWEHSKFYADFAMDYYFPTEYGRGITRKDWTEANYTCSKLDPAISFKIYHGTT